MKKIKQTFLITVILAGAVLLNLGITKSVDAATQRFACNDGQTLLPLSPSQGFNPETYCADHDGYSSRQVWVCDDGVKIVPPTFRGDVQAWCEDAGGFNPNEQYCEDSGGDWVTQTESVGGRQVTSSYCDCPGELLSIDGRCVEPQDETRQQTGGGESGTIDTDCESAELNRGNCEIINYIVITVNVLSALAGMAIIGGIIYGGYLYMTARDNAGQIQKAKQRIIWAIIALLVWIFTYVILDYLVPGGVF